MKDVLQAEAEGLLPPLYLFFGHRPSHAAPGPWVLSQWWEAPFQVEGVVYPTAEHYMMAGKARLFGDDHALAQILVAPGPREAKALGRSVRGFDQEVWDQLAFDLVVEGTRAKFSQNPALREFLLGTGDTILVEASPYDRIWGIGMSCSDKDVQSPSLWRGQNLLGFALMHVRRELRSEVVTQKLHPLRERVLLATESSPSTLAAVDTILREVASWVRDESEVGSVNLDLVSVAAAERLRRLADQIERAAT